MKNVSIIYSHFPHYRSEVFRLIRNDKDVNYRIFYGSSLKNDGIAPGKSTEDDVIVRNYSIGEIIFQFDVLGNDFVRKSDIIIFLGNPYILSNWIYAFILRLLGKKVLFWTHGWLSKERGLRGVIRRAYYRLGHGLLLYGNRARRIGESFGFDPKSMKVIYNSLDYDRQMAVREEALARGVNISGKPAFVFVGRLTELVALDVAIQALAILAARGLDVRLDVVGTGPELEKLKALACSYRVEVNFLGEIYDEETLGELFLQARAVVSPGKVGLLAMHALAYGTPVLTHGAFGEQMPEHEAIRAGVTGGFFEKGNAEALADLMEEWLDEGKRMAAVRPAIETIESFYTPSVQVRLINEFISSLG